MLSYLYMTNRTLASISAAIVIPAFLLSFAPAYAATPDFSLRVSKVTMVKMPPTCEVRATKKRMTSGGTVDIVWKSEHATRMTGLTRDKRIWPTKGREHFAIAFVGKHEFPMTFEGPGGTTTCVAKVFVKPKKDKKR